MINGKIKYYVFIFTLKNFDCLLLQSVAVGNGQETRDERVETRDERVEIRGGGQSVQSLQSDS